jgi:hypothetical protein
MEIKSSLSRPFGNAGFLLCAVLFGCALTAPVFARPMDLSPGHATVLSRAQSVDTTISPQDLKAYEGYYKFQFDPGTDSYIHIAAVGNGLVLKQMWDDKEISFTPESALDFIGDGGNFPLKFTKEPSGRITQVLAFNKDLWTKTTEYKPLVIKEVRLTASELKGLEGRYTFQFQNKEDAYIQIRSTDTGLVLKQLWDNKEIPFVAQSNVDFYSRAAQFPLKFTREKNGTASQVLAFNRDLWKRVKE